MQDTPLIFFNFLYWSAILQLIFFYINFIPFDKQRSITMLMCTYFSSSLQLQWLHGSFPHPNWKKIWKYNIKKVSKTVSMTIIPLSSDCDGRVLTISWSCHLIMVHCCCHLKRNGPSMRTVQNFQNKGISV